MTAVDTGTARIVCADGTVFEGVQAHGRVDPGGQALLMLRPERLRLRQLAAQEVRPGIEVIVRDVTYLGDSTHLAVETGWRQVVAVRLAIGADREGLEPGDRARVE